MRIDALALRNFRNYDALNVTFAPDCNVIVGENAQGKTNLLEAIVYLSSARSPRARAEKELISFGKSECSIKANAFARNRDFLLEIALAAGKRRKILINKVPVKKGSDLSDVLGAVYFCPEDLLLIRDGAAARRKLMDDALCQLRADEEYRSRHFHARKHCQTDDGQYQPAVEQITRKVTDRNAGTGEQESVPGVSIYKQKIKASSI